MSLGRRGDDAKVAVMGPFSLQMDSFWPLLAIVGASLVAACRAVPPPIPDPGDLTAPPGLESSSYSFAGSPLTGPDRASGAAAPDPDSVTTFEVEFRYLEADLAQLTYGTAPLSQTLDLALAQDRRAGVLGAAQLFDSARIVSGAAGLAVWTGIESGELGRTCQVLLHEGILWPGVAAGFEVSLNEPVIDADNFLREYPERGPVSKAVRLRVGKASGATRASIGIASAAPRVDKDDLLSPEQAQFRPGGPAPLEEWVRPALELTVASSPMVVLVPSPFKAGRGRTLALRIGLVSNATTFGSDAGSASLDDTESEPLDATGIEPAANLELRIQKALESAKRTAFQRFGTQRAIPVTSTERTVFAALEGLRHASDLRAVFAYLTGVLEPPLALDFVLTADESQLAELASAVATDRVREPETVGPKSGLGGSFDAKWSIERGAWMLLVQRALASELTPAGASLLLRHGGEVGRFPTLLEGALAAARHTDEFTAFLVRENQVFLSDASPAARVRAFDWLKARRLAPGGFDPLGTRGERRRILDELRAEQELEAAVAAPSQGGAQ